MAFRIKKWQVEEKKYIENHDLKSHSQGEIGMVYL